MEDIHVSKTLQVGKEEFWTGNPGYKEIQKNSYKTICITILCNRSIQDLNVGIEDDTKCYPIINFLLDDSKLKNR